jgi:PhnB protein
MSTDNRESDVLKTNIARWPSVRDCAAAVDFYKAAFGAEERHRLEDDSGNAVVARLSLDGAEFWVQSDADCSPASAGAPSVRMIVVVDAPDPRFERAVAAGATQIAGMADAHGWRAGREANPFGHQWEFARPLGKVE